MEIILSTCGTSILTNNTSRELQLALTTCANEKRIEDFPENERRMITEHIKKRKIEFAKFGVDKARNGSAELNGILAYYDNQPANGASDTHYLLATDTWLCEATAEVVQDWLKRHGIRDIRIHRHPDLQTADFGDFRSSLADLVKWCAEEVYVQHSVHRRIIFNLSGGFKSETGFLQLLGMFYADEIIYIFERSGELLRIPRLPLEMMDEKAISDDLQDFRRASLGLSVTSSKTGIYWFEDSGKYALTAWGELVFEKHRTKLYREKLLPSPSKCLIFGKNFKKSCTERHDEINRKIDLLAKYMEEPTNPNPKTLDFKRLQNNHPRLPEANWECDAWHDGAAKRIFCQRQGETLTLLELHNALH